MLVFFGKQETAYEMRISDWSSDVCSSDLAIGRTREDREAVVEAVREGTQESDLSRHMIRDQEIQLADERRFDRREIGDVENKVAKACDRGVARREIGRAHV